MDIKNLNQNYVNNRSNESVKQSETGSGKSASSTSPSDAKVADKVTLTDISSQIKSLEAKAQTANVDNTARIAELKQAIKDGTYQVDAEKVANKLIQTEALFARV